MKRKLIVLFGYLIGSLALVIPWYLCWIIGFKEIAYIKLAVITGIMWAMYITSISIITWNQDIEIRILRKKLKEFGS